MIRLRELRENHGLSMKDAADLLNMPYTTYVNYEKGTREPNIQALFRLANFFGVSIDDLLGRCAPNEPLTLDELREMDEIPIYVVTEKYGSGWCVLNWHGVKKSYTYFSRTGTSEGMTATPLSAKTYGDLWIAYRRPPEGDEDT